MSAHAKSRLIALCLGCAVAALAPLATQAQDAGKPMTFEEVMKDQRRIDAASFSPDGRKLMYSVQRNDRPSHGLAVAFDQYETFIADLTDGHVVRVGESGKGYAPLMMHAWSPDGRGLAVAQARDGQQALAYADAATGEVRAFGPVPSGMGGDWLGGKLVYLTEEGANPRGWARASSLAYLTRRWQAAWNGDEPQVTIQSNNPAVANPEKPVGGLAVADPATGAAQVVARGDFSSLKTSPDGKTFAAIKMTRAEPGALDSMTGRRGELQIFRLTADGAALVASFPDIDAGQYAEAWSPDGAKLLIGGRGADGKRSLFVIDMKTRAASPLQIPGEIGLSDTGAGVVASFRQLGWVDGRPAFIGETAGALAAESDVHSDYGETRRSGLRLYVATGQGATALTGFAKQSITRFVETASGEALVAVDGALWGVRPGKVARRISQPGLDVVGLAEGESSFGGPFQPAIHHDASKGDRVGVVTRGPDGGRRDVVLQVADGREIFSAPTEGMKALSPRLTASAKLDYAGWSSVLTTEGELARKVAETNPAWAGRPLPEAKHFTYQVDGRTLNGWVLLPPGHAGPAPAIVWIYGGQVMSTDMPHLARPEGAVTAVFSGPLWASQGYAVIYPSTPTGRGIDGDVPADLAKDTVAAVDAAAAQGWIDPNRVGIIGHSFGGYSTASVLTKRSDRFKAGIAMSGIYDPAAAWAARMPIDYLVDEDGHGYALETIGYIEHGQEGLAEPPWKANDAYVRNSPIYHAGEIKAPLMLTVGDLDLSPTKLEQSERFYAALRRTGNPAVMIRYWGETHVQDDPWAVRDEWARFTDWFGRYLK